MTTRCPCKEQKPKVRETWKDTAGLPWTEYECEGCGVRERIRGAR